MINKYKLICLFFYLTVSSFCYSQNKFGAEVTLGPSFTKVNDPNDKLKNGLFPSIIFSFPYYKQSHGFYWVVMPQIQGLAFGVKENFTFPQTTNTALQEWYLNLSGGLAKDLKWGEWVFTPELTLGLGVNIFGWVYGKYDYSDSIKTKYGYTRNGSDTLNKFYGSAKRTTFINPNINLGLAVSKKVSKNVYFYFKPRAFIGMNKIMQFQINYQDFENNLNGTARIFSRGNIFGITAGIGWHIKPKIEY